MAKKPRLTGRPDPRTWVDMCPPTKITEAEIAAVDIEGLIAQILQNTNTNTKTQEG